MTYLSWSSGFALKLEDYFMDENDSLVSESV